MTLQSLLENKPPVRVIKRAVWDNDKYLRRIPTEEIKFFCIHVAGDIHLLNSIYYLYGYLFYTNTGFTIDNDMRADDWVEME